MAGGTKPFVGPGLVVRVVALACVGRVTFPCARVSVVLAAVGLYSSAHLHYSHLARCTYIKIDMAMGDSRRCLGQG